VKQLSKDKKTKTSIKKRINLKRNWQLYVIFAIPLAYYILFKYVPMYGAVISFKDYNIFSGIMKSPWIGLRNFESLFMMSDFKRALRNTLMLNCIDLFFSFPVPIILSLALNELINVKFKKSVQTILYLPYFLSWVVIGGIAYQLFSTNNGIINILLNSHVPFLTNKYWWLVIYLVSGIWQSAGWNTIIYLAAISGIDPSLYEAVEMDGGGKFRQMIHITLPQIKPTIIVLLIMKIGSMMGISFERPYVMGNTLVTDFSDVLSTYVYRLGLQGGKFGLATAAGLFQSVVGFVLITIANLVSNRLGENGIW
jgi:putative aldouronate transport system permease protein